MMVHASQLKAHGMWLMAKEVWAVRATGPPRAGAGVGVGMLSGAGDSLTMLQKMYQASSLQHQSSVIIT